MSASPSTSSTRTPAEQFALVLGAVYLIVGAVGFVVTGVDQFAENTDKAIWIFEVNPLHNIVHLILGAGFLFGGLGTESAERTNFVLGFALIVVFILGVLGAATWLSVDEWYSADNWLHLITGAAAVFFGRARLQHDLTDDIRNSDRSSGTT